MFNSYSNILIDAVAKLSARNDDVSVVSIGKFMFESLDQELRYQEIHALMQNRRLLLLLRRSLSKLCKDATSCIPPPAVANITQPTKALGRKKSRHLFSLDPHLSAIRLHQLLW